MACPAILAPSTPCGKFCFSCFVWMLCGQQWRARCELPGFRFGACAWLCAWPAGHSGKCACELHIQDRLAPSQLAQGQLVPRAQVLFPEQAPVDEIQERPRWRLDHPPVYGPVRASKARMSQALATEAGRKAALTAFERDLFAPSGIAARCSRWDTWCYAASLWGVDPLPITEELITQVASALKAGGIGPPSRFLLEQRRNISFSSRSH